MTNIKKLAWQVIIPLVAIGLAGCDFSKPGAGEYWSDTYNWVNFSGTYKNPNGGAIVQSAIAAIPITTNGVVINPVVTNVVTTTVDGEVVGALSGSVGNYSGNLGHQSIVPGSLQLYSGDWTFNDGGSGNLSTSGGGFPGTGHVFYASGAWSVDTLFSLTPSSIGSPIRARYQYTVTTTSGGGTSGGGTSGGGSETMLQIFALTVMQEGNLINMTDSNGSQYSGNLGSLSGSNGSGDTTGTLTTPVNGDQVIAQYRMTGHDNLSGQDVEIVGTLQATVVRSGSSYYLANRTIAGTWMESDGTTLDISGVAGQISVNITTSTNTAAKVGI